jgi:hypothetical protein
MNDGRYFGGGAVSSVAADRDWMIPASDLERFEDGTLNYHGIAGLCTLPSRLPLISLCLSLSLFLCLSALSLSLPICLSLSRSSQVWLPSSLSSWWNEINSTTYFPSLSTTLLSDDSVNPHQHHNRHRHWKLSIT